MIGRIWQRIPDPDKFAIVFVTVAFLFAVFVVVILLKFN